MRQNHKYIAMTFFIASSVIAISLHPFWHKRLIDRNIYIDHAYHAVLAFYVIMMLAIIAMLIGTGIEQVIAVLLSVPMFRWIAHSSILNILRKKDVNYLGEEENRSLSDSFLLKVWERWGVQPIVFKIILFLSSLSLTIYVSI